MFGNLFAPIEKFDPDQPRHPAGTPEGGKWIATSEVAGNPAGSLMNEHTPYDKNTAGIKARSLIDEVLTPEQKEMYEANIAYVQRMIKTDPETGRNGESYRVYSKNPDGTGGFTRERLRVHRDIMNKVFENEDRYKPAPGEKPHVIVLGGLGGSGKSHFGKSEDSSSLGKYDDSKYLRIDTDEFKTMLAVKDGTSVLDSNNKPSVGKNAYLYHEESGRLFDRAVSMARRRGLNVVLDVTLNSAHENRLKAFKDNGYKVSGYYMHLPNEEAARRAVTRAFDRGTMNGRMVPPDYVLTAKNNGKNFDLLLKYMDDAEVYRNDVPRGTKPKLVYSVTREKKGELVFKYGTTEGAIKAWEVRRTGGEGPAEKKDFPVLFSSSNYDWKVVGAQADRYFKLDSHANSQWKDFSDGEREAFKHYTEASSIINRVVTGRQVATDRNDKAAITNLDRALNRSTIAQDVTAFRGMAVPNLFKGMNVKRNGFSGNRDIDKEILDSMVGRVYTETAYPSTTLKPTFPSYAGRADEGGKVGLRISIPSGSKGFFVGARSKVTTEEEILLPRNSRFMITGYDMDANKKYGGGSSVAIHVDLLPPEEK